MYTADPAERASYQPGLVSLPASGSFPVDPSGLLAGDELDRWQQWKSRLLRNSSDAAALRDTLGLRRPYSDPKLVNDRQAYRSFIDTLIAAGLVQLGSLLKSSVGVFFVKNKNGRLRLIFDTRIANTRFVDPSHTDLPTASSFSRLEVPEGQLAYMAQCDLADAF